MDKSDLLPIPEGERVPILVPIPKIWMDMFDTIAAKRQLDRPTFILQLIARQAQTIATRVGGETAPLSSEETEGEFRTIVIEIPIADMVPIDTAAALHGVDPSILIGEALARGIADSPRFPLRKPSPR